MAEFGTVQLPDWGKVNSLFDNNAIQNEQLRNALLVQGVRQAQLANQFTEAVQPSQVNDLLSLGQLNASLSPQSAPPSPGDTGNGQPGGLAVRPVQPGQSLLAGETPTAADAAAQQKVGQIAQAAGVNPEWAKRVQYAESGSFPNSMSAVSPAGAIGTMQLMPDTAKTLGVDPRHPDQNVQGGVNYLKQMKDQFGDPVIATAAYNAGPGRVTDWLSGKAALPAETVDYVGKVFGGNGIQLLNNAMGGGHGHPIAGVDVPQSGTGLQSVPMDDAARNAVKQLVLMRNVAMRTPGGAGMRAVAGIQAQLDNIAGPGGIVDPGTGNVFRVPGSSATRFAASQAAKAGEVGPATQLAANKGVIEQGTHAANVGVDVTADRAKAEGRIGPETQIAANRGVIEQGTHAANTAVDVTAAGLKPMKTGPGETVMIPANQGVVPAGSGLQPASGETGALPVGLSGTPQVPAITPNGTIAAPAATPGIYRAPAEDPSITYNKEEGKRWSELAGKMPALGADAARAIGTIDSAQSQLAKASEAGVPTGYFAPWLGEASAAAKSLGIDLSSLGVKPEAVSDLQSARKSLAIVSGEILRDIMGQGQRQITNKDLNSFISATPGIETDPQALQKILSWARSQAQYNLGMAHSFLNRHGDVGTWERQWYQGQNGKGNFGPVFNPLTGEMSQPGAPTQATPAVSAPSAAVEHLKANPSLAAQFDQKYGAGASQRVLGQ